MTLKHLLVSQFGDVLLHKSGFRAAFLLVTLYGAASNLASPILAQDTQPQDAEAERASVTENQKQTAEEASELQFAFERTPWREVIKWIADEADLALHYEDLPVGSFSYNDPNDFSVQGAIDRLNLFLLPQGYTLVRSGRLLSVINLGDPRSMQQLDSMAALVTSKQLDDLPLHDVVKCMFDLGELKSDDAVQELSPLNLMTTPEVFEKTNRLMVTDSVKKLLNVRMILEAFEPKALANGTVMKNFSLQHVTAEDILLVARPHLGLATGEMIGIDVSLSADLQGKNIFVTGLQDKVKLIESLVQQLDVPQGTVSTADGKTVLESYRVPGGNLQAVYDVLQTLLAGKSLRLSMDRETDSIVALATPEIQDEIAQTVMRMQADEADFEVIPLRTIDPYFAISLLEEMLDLPDSYDDRDDSSRNAPRVDADPGNMRLFVRGKPHQIAQIRKIVEGLDAKGQFEQEQLRVLPLKGTRAVEALETSALFWREENPILLLPSQVDAASKPTERTINGRGNPSAETAEPDESDQPQAGSSNRPRLTSALTDDELERGSVGLDGVNERTTRILTRDLQTDQPAIRAQVTPRGLLLQSDDASALSRLEEQLLTIAGPESSAASPPIVFYLKFTKPDDALKMLAELLDGGVTAKEGEAGSLVNGYISSPSSYFGSIVVSRDGMLTMMAGSITVVADTRLNRLIAQGTTADIERIEQYLEIIDKEKSLTDVETYGRSHVVELEYTQANEVAATIRDAYAGRIAGAASGAAGAAGGGRGDDPRQQQSRDQSRDRDDRSDNGRNSGARGGGRTAVDLEPKLSVAVHEASNSLIVTAPDQLFEEVSQLIAKIDQRSQQTVEIISPANAALIETLLGGQSSSGSRSSRDRGSASSRFSEYLRSRSRSGR